MHGLDLSSTLFNANNKPFIEICQSSQESPRHRCGVGSVMCQNNALARCWLGEDRAQMRRSALVDLRGADHAPEAFPKSPCCENCGAEVLHVFDGNFVAVHGGTRENLSTGIKPLIEDVLHSDRLALDACRCVALPVRLANWICRFLLCIASSAMEGHGDMATLSRCGVASNICKEKPRVLPSLTQ